MHKYSRKNDMDGLLNSELYIKIVLFLGTLRSDPAPLNCHQVNFNWYCLLFLVS